MCNCKKNKQEEPIVPQTPAEQHAVEITEWNGGINVEIKTTNTDEESNNERPA